MSKALSISLVTNKTIPTNITSSMAQSATRKHFAVLTRQLSETSSQYIYRLELYENKGMTKLDTIVVYQTYNVDKHHLTFISGKNIRIAVATIYNLVVYDYMAGPNNSPMKLTQIVNFPHLQPQINDLQASFDGQLLSLVGQNTILMYRNVDYKPVNFMDRIQNSTFTTFSRDNRYLAVTSTTQIFIYQFQRINNDYLFTKAMLNGPSSAKPQFGQLTSIQFNPTNSSELIIGFISASPMGFNIESSSFFYKFKDTQPQSALNPKIVHYFPDGNRGYSFDYLVGIGIWPGLNNTLLYMQNYLMYDLNSNLNGTRIIGYVWQTIKAVDIIIACDNGKNSSKCECLPGSYWDYSTYRCKTLVCSTFSTGVNGNQCSCVNGFRFNHATVQCELNCQEIKNALPVSPTPSTCNCYFPLTFNSTSLTCQFQCYYVPFSTGNLVSPNQCECIPSFVWNATTQQCQCPMYMKTSGPACVCYDQYYFDKAANTCYANCSLITGANYGASTPQECLCGNGYYYSVNVNNQIAGCQLNCSSIPSTLFPSNFTTCTCFEHMNWNGSSCIVSCKDVSYADVASLPDNTCKCAVNYIWIDSIKECAKNCTGQPYINLTKHSTLIACPCINQFVWNQAYTRCQIDCTRLKNTRSFGQVGVNQCDCREGFTFNTESNLCLIDCTKIWNGNQRVADDACSCLAGQQFDNTTMTCNASTNAIDIFKNAGIIVGFVVATIVIIGILIVLARFCWKFKTENNREHQKKLKKDGSYKKMGPKLNTKKKQVFPDEPMKTAQRIRTTTTV